LIEFFRHGVIGKSVANYGDGKQERTKTREEEAKAGQK
jgi:hypothetical protein